MKIQHMCPQREKEASRGVGEGSLFPVQTHIKFIIAHTHIMHEYMPLGTL